MSVGIASYPENADTIGTLLYAADKALYDGQRTLAQGSMDCLQLVPGR